MIVALAGGVGGAKMVEGLAHALADPADLTVIVNTADDAEFHGLHVSPDSDTIMYTLAGIVNRETGWGVAGDTVAAMAMLGEYGEEAWFRLGDRDLATHILRTRWLRAGWRLTEIAGEMCRRLGVPARLLPMSDDPVRSVVLTPEGEIDWQDFFVRRRGMAPFRGIRLAGIESARPTPEVLEALHGCRAIVFAPSNPLASLGPILALPGVRDAIETARAVRAGVSPLVGGAAIKGPLVAMMEGIGLEPTSTAVARMYRGLLDVFVIDPADAAEAAAIEALGMQAVVRPTLMTTLDDKIRVARAVLELTR
ncbi:MAG: 2-phospho-L-lactate transferase [Armatimonadetes bacterium]|nr:2-phospho-L-lactate transferase [Armatimonadota bacterium]